jgi:16S rRNA (guanine527-N7)-methyltransferase
MEMNAQSFAEQFDVSRETMVHLTTYQGLLGKWQKSVNLVGPSTLTQYWHRHVADCAQILALAPKSARTWLDIGSGAGFPGLVLAILLADRAEGGAPAHVHLVESDRKKVSFLRAVLRDTGAPASVHHMRIETLSDNLPEELAQVDVITARALASMPSLAGLMAPFFNPSTIALLHKGRDWQEELTQAQQYWKLETIAHESRTDADARLIEVRALAAR